jgi:hypothetical protein
MCGIRRLTFDGHRWKNISSREGLIPSLSKLENRPLRQSLELRYRVKAFMRDEPVTGKVPRLRT